MPEERHGVARSQQVDALDDRRGAHAAADAERGEAGREVAPLQLVEQRAQDHRAGGAQRMAHGDGAAVHVDLVVRHLEDLQVAQHDGGEGLVQLPEIDVLHRHAGALQRLLRGGRRTGQHDRGLRADRGEGADARPRLQPGLLAELLGADQDGGSAIDDARRIAGMVDMVDLLDLGIALLRHRVEARHHLALHLEAGLEGRQRLHGRLRPHQLVVGQKLDAVLVLHRHDRLLEVAGVPGGLGALLRFDGVGVDVVAAQAILGGDQVGRDALGHEVHRDGHGRIGRPGAAVGAHGHARHRFDAAADRGLALARHDLRRRHVGGFEARGAEAVDLHARHGLGIARDDGRGAGDVGTLLADRHDAAQHDVVDQVGVELVAVAQRLQGGDGEPHRGHFVQRAILAALAARGADGVVDECVGHGWSPNPSNPAIPFASP